MWPLENLKCYMTCVFFLLAYRLRRRPPWSGDSIFWEGGCCRMMLVCVRESDESGSGTVNICKLEPTATESTVPARVEKQCCSDANKSNRKTGRSIFLAQPCSFLPLLPNSCWTGHPTFTCRGPWHFGRVERSEPWNQSCFLSQLYRSIVFMILELPKPKLANLFETVSYQKSGDWNSYLKRVAGCV